MYTHKVLRQLQIMISQTDLSFNLWLVLLQVFLAIGDTVLSPSYRSTFDINHIFILYIFSIE